MKNKFTYFISFLLLTGMAACTQNPPGKQKNNADQTANGNARQKATTEPVKADFKEGVIDVKITIPESMLGKVMGRVDPSKGDVQGQMRKIAMALSTSDRDKLQAESSKMGMMAMGLVMLPMKSTLYVKGNEVLAKMEALTYYGENYINNDKKTGFVYLKSRNSKNDISFTYDEKNMYKVFAGTLSNKDYNIVKTTETAVIAGYNCTKSVYTAKNSVKTDAANPAAQTPGEGNPGDVYKVEVWTSPQMPQSLNFVHPLYVEEAAGIMKLVIYPSEEGDVKLLYEINSIENKSVSAKDLEVQRTAKVYDYGKDIQTLGFKLMGIMMGM